MICVWALISTRMKLRASFQNCCVSLKRLFFRSDEYSVVFFRLAGGYIIIWLQIMILVVYWEFECNTINKNLTLSREKKIIRFHSTTSDRLVCPSYISIDNPEFWCNRIAAAESNIPRWIMNRSKTVFVSIGIVCFFFLKTKHRVKQEKERIQFQTRLVSLQHLGGHRSFSVTHD